MKIAISGESGCGNTTVSKTVARKLNLKPINYTLRNLARDLKKPFSQIQKEVAKHPAWDVTVDKKQIQFAIKEKKCVLASRLATWTDDKRVLKKTGATSKPKYDLKVWLHAPLKTRAKRIAKREKKTLATALRETRKRDAQNRERYKNLYNLSITKHKHFFQVNTEKNTALQVAQIIINKVKNP
ncbi:MAG: (d)CMP kinase [Candidatus Micrarchaeia archaeon]